MRGNNGHISFLVISKSWFKLSETYIKNTIKYVSDENIEYIVNMFIA